MKMLASIIESKKIALFIAFIMVLSAVSLFAEAAHAASTGTLAVMVQGPGKAGVSVEVSGGDLMTPKEKKTAASGLVSFTGLAPGTYTVTPRKAKFVFAPESKDAVVKKNKTTQVKFVSTAQAAKAGMSNCVLCHKALTPDVYANWLQSPHGNFNYLDGSLHKNDYSDFLSTFSYPADYSKFTGVPNDTIITDLLKTPAYHGKSKKYCLGCHGPSAADNKKVAEFPLIKADGTVDASNTTQIARPVGGCEVCHGGGSNHVDSPLKKSVTFKVPSAVECGQCHNKNFPAGHLTDNPAGAGGQNNVGIYEAYKSSPHANSIQSSNYSNLKKKEVTPLCSKCHTDQGARLYSSKHGDASTLPGLFTGEAALKKPDAVQCRTCHSAHNPKNLLETATAATLTATARSAQFNTCTNCHQLLTDSDGKITPYHSDHTKSLTVKHYDDPATGATGSASNTVASEGYNVNRASASACTNCHNPHNANTKINKQWAASGHGDLAGDPWNHYNWKGSSRAACQKCHTATGFANYVTNPSTYSAASNNFSYLSGGQNELLYCNGCHKDSAFSLRSLSSVTFPSGLTGDLGDASNLCLVCHSGRESKVTIDTQVATPIVAPVTGYGFTNIHYYAAAASLFGTDAKGGYEYSAKTYVGRNTFSGHAGNKRNTCIKCHMRTDSADSPDHHFVPEVSDCAACHGKFTDFKDLSVGGVVLKTAMDNLQTKLLTQIQFYATNTLSRAIGYNGASNPYWFYDANGNGVIDSSETVAYAKTCGSGSAAYVCEGGFDAKLLKAAYNYQVSQKEPHGYIHNHKYIGELLYDSLDDLGGDLTGLTRP